MNWLNYSQVHACSVAAFKRSLTCVDKLNSALKCMVCVINLLSCYWHNYAVNISYVEHWLYVLFKFFCVCEVCDKCSITAFNISIKLLLTYLLTFIQYICLQCIKNAVQNTLKNQNQIQRKLEKRSLIQVIIRFTQAYNYIVC